jgi:hypothetical protein
LNNFEPISSLRHDDFNLVEASGNLYVRRLSADYNDVVVVITSLHPGRIAYQGNLNKLIKALFMMTMMRTWLALEAAFYHSTYRSSKPALCAEIVKAVDKKTGVGTAFHQDFEELKKQYLEKLRRRKTELWLDSESASDTFFTQVREAYSSISKQMRQESGVRQQRQAAPERAQSIASTARWVVYSGPPGTVMSSPLAIWAQGKKELDIVLACGFSRTHPKTIERQEEVMQVFSKHAVGLGSLSAPESTQSDFIEIGLSAKLPFQGSFYLSLTTTDEATKDLPNLIRCFLPESISDPYNMKHILRTNATSRISALTILRSWLAHRVSLEHHDHPDALKQRISRDWDTYMRQRNSRVFDVLSKHARDKTACNEVFHSQGSGYCTCRV